MIGGFSTPKKDRVMKVSGGQKVKIGQLLARGVDLYKAGANVKGPGALVALCAGNVYFTKKKTSHGKTRTFINIKPEVEETVK